MPDYDLRADQTLLDLSFKSSILDDSILHKSENNESDTSKIIVHDIQIFQPNTENLPKDHQKSTEFQACNENLQKDTQKSNEIQTLTKKGEYRKRKKYNTPVKERKAQKVEKQREKFNLKRPCVNCSKKCSLQFSESRRIELNKNYQALDYIGKKKFVLSNTEQSDVKKNEGSKRCRSIQYFFQDDNGKRIKTCKMFFLTTLGYHEKNDRFVLQAITRSENHISVSSDMRGTYGLSTKFILHRVLFI